MCHSVHSESFTEERNYSVTYNIRRISMGCVWIESEWYNDYVVGETIPKYTAWQPGKIQGCNVLALNSQSCSLKGFIRFYLGEDWISWEQCLNLLHFPAIRFEFLDEYVRLYLWWWFLSLLITKKCLFQHFCLDCIYYAMLHHSSVIWG